MTNPKPKPTPKRINESTHGHLSGAQMREGNATDRHVELSRTAAREWRAYRSATPIAAETFVTPALCAALDELADEVLG